MARPGWPVPERESSLSILAFEALAFGVEVGVLLVESSDSVVAFSGFTISSGLPGVDPPDGSVLLPGRVAAAERAEVLMAVQSHVRYLFHCSHGCLLLKFPPPNIVLSGGRRPFMGLQDASIVRRQKAQENRTSCRFKPSIVLP